MSTNDFIINMLNIDRNIIERITTIKSSDDIIAKIRLKPKPCICPDCNSKMIIHGYVIRNLKHTALVNRKCTIVYERRRYYCKNCKTTTLEDNPFINSKEHVTYETKINVLMDLKNPAITYTTVANRYNLSVTNVLRIFDKHVDIPRKPLPKVLSIDEHYFPESNFDSLYCLVMLDFLSGEVIDVLPDRKKKYFSNYLNNIKNATLDPRSRKSELNNVKYVSIDMYDTYRELAHQYFPKALVCADSFHVIKNLTEAFQKVIIRCRKQTEDDKIIYLLTKFRRVLYHDTDIDNKGKYNRLFNRKLNYRDMQTILFERFPYLKKAYELKERYISFNRNATYETANEQLLELIEAFGKSDIKEYEIFYNTLINWHDEIVNSFIIIDGKRINNSYIESINRKIELLFYNSNGFTNFRRTRNRLLYCLNPKDRFKI